MQIIREDKSVVGITHIHMEIPQGNSLYSYLFISISKNVMFFFYLSFSAKSENRRVVG
jgi:hypothetical protein